MPYIESALDLPRSHGGPVGTGRIRLRPEDFVVREWLGFEADGEGDHVLLTVRKRGANTHWVAKQLARIGKLHPRDVGFAGLKDRDAVTEQAFTVPLRSAVGADWTGLRGDGFEVLAAARHRRKLKRGALRGNAFEIVIREWRGESSVLEERLVAIASLGAPNYFGPQRFGRDGGNLDAAQAWFVSGNAPHDRLQRSFALSAARAVIFNAVLAARILQGTWNRLLPGELVNLNGSGSIFHADIIDAALEERCRALDVHPTGPLWGAGAAVVSGSVAALEEAVAGRFPGFAAGLGGAGLEAERRALRVVVEELRWTIESDSIRLQFRLGRGAFATAVLYELLDDAFMQIVPDGDAE